MQSGERVVSRISLLTYLFIHSFIYLFIYLSIYLLFIYLFIYSSIYLNIHEILICHSITFPFIILITCKGRWHESAKIILIIPEWDNRTYCTSELKMVTPEMQTIIDRTEEICTDGSVCVHVMANYKEQQHFIESERHVSNPNNQSYLYKYKGCKSLEECMKLCNESKEIHKGYISCSRYCCLGDNCNENETANNG